MIITIDGPAASGKSTVSRALAHALGFYYVCSGLLYRAIAYCLVNQYGYNVDTIEQVRYEDIKKCIDLLKYEYDAVFQERLFFNNQDITSFLKDKYIDYIVSLVSVNEQVRAAVTCIQHTIAHDRDNIVIDGRDVGSVVFPDAEIKFFLTASVEVRAQRWRNDQEKYNNYLSFDEAVTLITERDERDKNRVIAPLIIPDKAIIIDTSSLNKEQTVKIMINYINNY